MYFGSTDKSRNINRIANNRLRVIFFLVTYVATLIASIWCLTSPWAGQHSIFTFIIIATESFLVGPLLCALIVAARLRWKYFIIFPAISMITLHAFAAQAFRELWGGYLYYKIAVSMSLIVIELWLIGKIILQFRKTAKLSSPEDALTEAVKKYTKASVIADILIKELLMWYYLLFVWGRKRFAVSGDIYFTYYKDNALRLMLATFIVVIAVETVVTHFMIMYINSVAAWVVSALTVYFILFLIANYQAIKYRPVSLHDSTLSIRHGLLFTKEIALNDIACVKRTHGQGSNKSGSVLRAFLPIVPGNVSIILNNTFTHQSGLRRRRNITEIHLALDNPSNFISTLSERLDSDEIRT